MNWNRAGVAALVAVPFIALLGWGLTRDPRDIPSPLPGREAPAFSMQVFAAGQPPLAKNIGDTVSLGQYKGQVVVLNFWASWCLACRDEHRVLSDVALQYAGKPVHFIGVLYNDDAKSGTEWIANMGGQSYPSVLDPKTRTAIDYGLYGVPETFFVDSNGRVAYKHTGPIAAPVLTRIIDSLMTAATKPGA